MNKLFICFLLLTVGCVAAIAQERIIDESTYNEQMRKAGEYRVKENYREKRIFEIS